MTDSDLITEAKASLVESVKLALWSLYAIEGYSPSLIREAAEKVIKEMEDNLQQINNKK